MNKYDEYIEMVIDYRYDGDPRKTHGNCKEECAYSYASWLEDVTDKKHCSFISAINILG